MKRYEDLIKQIELYGIIPVVKVENVEDALPLVKALCDGGLKVAKVIFRTECAKEMIRTMTSHFPKMLIGAGTVLTTKQVDEAIEAGARFIVSPGLNKKIVKYYQEKEILMLRVMLLLVIWKKPLN